MKSFMKQLKSVGILFCQHISVAGNYTAGEVAVFDVDLERLKRCGLQTAGRLRDNWGAHFIPHLY